MAVITPVDLDVLAKAIDPGVRKHFGEEWKAHMPMVEKIFKIETLEDFSQEQQNYTGLGDMPIVTPGANYTTGANMQAYQTVYSPTKYGENYTIYEELLRYGKEKSVYDGARMQAAQAAEKMEKVGAAVFNNGFTSTATSLSDNQELFSTQHPRSDGGTAQSNASATGITLTEANLETAMLALESILDDRGKGGSKYFADTLLVPPALRKEAIEIVKSPGRSGVADNDTNVYNKALVEFEGVNIDKIMVWQYLRANLGGSDTAWYLLSMPRHKIMWMWGKDIGRPELTRVKDGDRNDTITYKVRWEAATGWQDWRGAWGSKGDGAAYSS